MKHFIAMAGIGGRLPKFVSVYDDFKDAVEGLSDLHELGLNRKAKLKKYGYLSLNFKRDGNTYAIIEACDCDKPETHSEVRV